ncbi:hypothetical protein HPB52_021593 [Rhipicephalus sanguineus]|uniref:cDENN domain-containing protein n=1 Tax=Rhipicephalus sanguineus TaxID=34632 RepID=A0A9D4Q7W3_RHISA|nr:hypothetical protein HPB52_021593 [Rhipicephalus sanguineus]
MAWDRVTPTTIANCFAKCGFFRSSEEVPSEQEEPIEGWELLDAGCTAEDFCTADDNLATCGARTVEDIVEEATCEVADSSDDGDNIDEGDGEGPPPAAETLHALDVLRRAMAADEISDDTSSEEVPSEQEEPIEGWELLDAGCTAEDFCTADDNLATCGARTVEDIVEEATCEVADSSDDGDNIDEGDGEGLPPAAETLHALDVLRRAMAADEISDDTLLRSWLESVECLTYPFRWPHVRVCLVPKSLLALCSSAEPYLLGVHASMAHTALELLSGP